MKSGMNFLINVSYAQIALKSLFFRPDKPMHMYNHRPRTLSVGT